MGSLFDNLPDPESLRAGAERERGRAEAAFQSSEYPRTGRAAHLELAQAMETLAQTIEETPEPATSGNRREDRRARRIARLKLRAAKLRQESASTWCAEHAIGNRIPFGQPILVGHHSEKRHRRAVERMQNLASRASAQFKAAKDAERAAEAAECNTAIYSDDPDAIKKLEAEAASLEEQREIMKALNKEFRRVKGDIDKMTGITDDRRARLKAARERYYLGPARYLPFESYQLSNLGANLRRIQGRIAELKKRATVTERPERMIGDIRVVDNLEFHKVELHFPGKPDEKTRANLKAWGFRWIRTAGCWARGIGSATEWRLQSLAESLGKVLRPASEPDPEPFKFPETWCPEFCEHLQGLADQYRKPIADVVAWWREYCKTCQNYDQSPVKGEFWEWYRAKFEA